MNRPVIRSVVAGLILTAVALSAVSYARLRPHLEIAERTYSGGQVWRGAKINHEFLLRNTGGSDIAVGKIDTSCFCAVTNLDQLRIAPGQSARLGVVVDTAEFMDGDFTKEIAINTYDSRSPRTSVAITGSVKSEFKVSDSHVDFGLVPTGQSIEREVTVAGQAGRAVHVVSVESTVPQLSASLRAKDESVRIIVHLKPLNSSTWLGGNLVVRTTSSLRPEFRIPVSGHVVRSK
jgi:hypothetical protein